MQVTFKELSLTPSMSKAVDEMGFEKATPIQTMSIPLARSGKDLIGQAQTGTGKTAAFGIPMLEKIDSFSTSIQGLVVTPTRELAIQVAGELNKIGKFSRIRTLAVYGGQEISRQINALKKRPHIIVGTPGRLLDHMRRKTIRLHDVRTVVLDEADEMLNMGFIDDIQTILASVPEQRQTLLFSATMPEEIRKLAEKFMRSPEMVRVQAKEMTVESIEQQYIEVQEFDKFDVLCRLLDIHLPERAIVFGRTKRRVDELQDALRKRRYSAKGLHGDLTQARRDRVMNLFKNGEIKILIATDVAARGLDIPGVTHVYNFDVPQDRESYVHRIGRTGRAGKDGIAVTLVTPPEIGHLRAIERLTKHPIHRMKKPTFEEAKAGRQKEAVDKLRQTVKEGDYSQYLPVGSALLERFDEETIIAAALKMLTKEPDTSPVRLTAEKPLARKKAKKRPSFQKGKAKKRGFKPRSRKKSSSRY